MAKATINNKIDKISRTPPSKIVYSPLKLYAKQILNRFNVSFNYLDHIPEKGPCFILFNHAARIDYIYVAWAALPRRLNFVSAYHEFYHANNFRFLRLLHAIPKRNYVTDLQAIAKIKEAINNGCAVAIAPEGKNSNYGCSTPIHTNTGGFLKNFHVPVYVAKINGSYLSCPKASNINRYGKIEVTLKKIDLEKIDNKDLDNYINEELRYDDYSWQEEQKIKWQHKDSMANNLERILYKCPKCGQEFKMVSHDNTIECKNCHYQVNTDEYYHFKDPLNNFKSPSEWVRFERKAIINEIKNNSKYSFNVHVKLGTLDPYKFTKKGKMSNICGEGIVTVDHQGLHFQGKKNNKPFVFNLDYHNVFTLGVTQCLNSNMIYVNNEFYELFPEYHCVLKLKMLVEEMQRLHTNIWPNFKWEDNLYH